MKSREAPGPMGDDKVDAGRGGQQRPAPAPGVDQVEGSTPGNRQRDQAEQRVALRLEVDGERPVKEGARGRGDGDREVTRKTVLLQEEEDPGGDEGERH